MSTEADQSAKVSKIMSLETSVQSLTRQKDDLFDQLQLRSAELESSQSLLEVLQSHTKELEFRLRESTDQTAALREELSAVVQGNSPGHIAGENRSNEEVARLLLETQGKYESRLSEARTKVRTLEKERLQAEEDWNRGIIEKSKALEQLRLQLESKEMELGSLVDCQKDTGVINSNLESSLKELNATLRRRDLDIEELKCQLSIACEQEASLGQRLHDANEKIDTFGLQLESAKEREVQLKANNKV
jgi:chromosome segregation ATPase